MPVLSPHHTSSTYRSAFNSSLDRQSYYGSSSYRPRISSYSTSERYSSRSYIDSDGRRSFSRSSSITEDGVTSRFNEEFRGGSVKLDSNSRDLGIGAIHENSVTDFSIRRERESSLTRDSSRLSSAGVNDELANLRSKYSPSNYVPTIHRKNEYIIRSKSISDIGLPPIEKTKMKVTEVINSNVSALPTTSTSTNDNCSNNDNNGNKASVADLRKRFDTISDNKISKSPLNIETADVKVSYNKFKLLDQTNLRIKDEINGDRTAKKSIPTKTNVKKTQMKSDEIDADSIDIKVVEIPGIHVDADELSNSRDSLKMRNLDKHRDGIDKRVINIEKKTAINPERQKAKALMSEEHDFIDHCNVLSIKINIEPTESTDGIVESTNKASHSTEEVDSEINGEQINSTNKSISDLRVENFAYGSPAENVYRSHNFASYVSSNDLNGCDKQPTIVNVVFQSENDESQYAEKPTIYSKVLTSSPKLNKNRVSPSSSAAATNIGPSAVLNSSSLGRKSVERERRNNTFDDEVYVRSPNIGYRLGAGSPTTVNTASTVKTLGLNGLKNIGNTCFMNSVIQCLSNTKLLLEYLRDDAYIKDINQTNSSMKGALIKAFAEVIKELWAEDSCDKVVNTVSLKNQIQRFASRFMGYAQQDAQEFLRYLLEGLHEDVNQVKQKPKSILVDLDDKLNDADRSSESWNRYLRMDNSRIVDIFVGQLKSTLKCTFCGHCSVTFDPFWDLSLPIPTRTGQLRLSQCLEHFTREETLDGDEKPTCSKCKERRKCTKSFAIQRFPKILVIHLKRFSPTERFRGKLNVTVDFPLEALDMSKYAADSVSSSRYNLYAVSNHSGTTYSGHYTAYCRHPYSLTWHEYNDSRVSAVSPRSIVSSEAYVLFYEQEGQRSHL